MQSPLHMAVAAGEFELVKALIEHGAIIDAADRNGITPLQLAIEANNLKMEIFLLDHNAYQGLNDHVYESQAELGIYSNDLRKTDLIYRLISIPKSVRDDNWKDQFLSHVAAASFRCGTPQVAIGTDGFPYFQLFVPEPGIEFQCFVIDKMINNLISHGFGVVINSNANNPEWVFSYGDILNYHLNNRFFSNDSLFSKHIRDEILPKQEKLYFGEPSEKILPLKTRKIL